MKKKIFVWKLILGFSNMQIKNLWSKICCLEKRLDPPVLSGKPIYITQHFLHSRTFIITVTCLHYSENQVVTVCNCIACRLLLIIFLSCENNLEISKKKIRSQVLNYFNLREQTMSHWNSIQDLLKSFPVDAWSSRSSSISRI